MRDPWIRLTFVIGLAIALLMTGLTAWQLVGEASRLTAPRQLLWTTGQAHPNCSGDESLRSVLWGERLVIPCAPSPELAHGGFAQLLPARGRAAVSWPLPEGLPLGRTEGVLADGGERLGLVFRTARGGLAVGVAGPDGWSREPERLPLPDEAVVLGMAWLDDQLELATSGPTQGPVPEGWNGPRVLSVPLAGGPITSRDLPPDRLCDPGWLRCQVQAGLRQPGARVWRLLVAAGDPAALWTAVENGVRHQLEGVEFPWDAREDVDLTVAGLIVGSSLRLTAAWSVEGELQPLNLADRTAFAGWSRDYQADPGGRLSRRRHFSVGDTSVVLEPEDGPAVGLERSSQRSQLLRAYRQVNPRVRAEAAVARLTPDCAELTAGILVLRDDGGFWALSPSGCLLTIAPDASRADPLTLLEHLRQRGSTCGDCDAWHLPWFLGWVLLGLPLSLGVAWAWTARVRNRERRRALEPLLLAAVVLAYDVVSAVLLTQLLPALGF